ncbi:MAG: SOS response-associated peptidase [Chitinophagaceae bacterium]|nr:SOS response-associated peptidase [Chitinophagaceae bacterium]
MCYNYEDLEHRARKRWQHDHPGEGSKFSITHSSGPLIISTKDDESLFPGRKGNIILLGESEVRPGRFGLVSSWNKKLSDAKSTFNARNDSITIKPTWKGLWKNKQRCLVQTSGFYETDKKTKQKYFFTVKGTDAFYYGGLYNWWTNPENADKLLTYAIITTEPNALVMDYHNRMPWIIDQDIQDNWMNPQFNPEELLKMMNPYPHFLMDIIPVKIEDQKSGQADLGF